MTAQRLDGPRLPPAAGGAARQLVVFLHGYGADGNDLIGLGREWARLLPHAAFVSPHAPEACGMAPMGRQWFNLTFRDPGEMTRGVAQAGPVLDAFLAAELERLRLPSSALGLVGFSQGDHGGARRGPHPQPVAGSDRRLLRRARQCRGPCRALGLWPSDPARAWRHWTR